MGKITEENILRWKQLVREHEFIYEKESDRKEAQKILDIIK